ncbi:ABC-2 type transport system permease protein [Paenibacillus sp. UNCCL117]|uniref:ABC transporter permease n=1 Tax=unclassified Paenibacillus TaxID=185978 RepID=UPI00088E368A|nr:MULTISPECIES: ABC transporter permease [unclassified Paenibacillus]SDE51422.1 ABC-2 type transport system permease protein [Paenibacillus sp. cl123]SFW67151.1 ABC-2 type transport system permease protein [Paenibacillus sp. UNCCL117]
MLNLIAGIQVETVKLLAKRRSLLFLGVTLLVPFLAAWLLTRFQNGIGLGAVTARDFPILMLNLFTSVLFPLFVFMGAADSFSGEIGERTMKLTLTRPVSRFKIFAAKQTALALYIALCVLAGLLSSSLAALFFRPGGGAAEALLDGVLAYSAALLPLLTLSIAAACVAQLFSTGSSALTATLLLYAGLKAAAMFVPSLGVYSPTAYTGWHMLWLGGTAAAGSIASAFMFLAACSILFFTVGFYGFDKKEL